MHAIVYAVLMVFPCKLVMNMCKSPKFSLISFLIGLLLYL